MFLDVIPQLIITLIFRKGFGYVYDMKISLLCTANRTHVRGVRLLPFFLYIMPFALNFVMTVPFFPKQILSNLCHLQKP